MLKADFVKAISTFVPSRAVSLLWDFFDKNPVDLRITKDRITKYGDFRFPTSTKINPKITVNGSLNEFSFLITILHEIAHYMVYKNYKSRVKPHGLEWKSEFQKIMIPYFNIGVFTQPLESVLRRHMANPKASTHADLDLVRCLLLYNKSIDSSIITLESLNYGDKFILNGRIFKKGEKRRTRYFCKDITTKNIFTINALAEVKII